ncbi:TIGR02677 family protein [Metasolibacillus sp. FSL K6-0083]|uniref:TIGR02677 family protein n=1 Tax=Metasolibacillus sp. FSL K6-0083 TaxID=2921416 RepID=UPI00315A48B2
MSSTMKQVVEATYLTSPSAGQYRTILRFFYRQHERMRDYITPEEVLQHLRSLPPFIDYDEEQLHQQLAQLVKWNNLSARQDMTNARTIEEYKKKRFRYQPTPYTIEIERMLVELESKIDDTFKGSLERSQFERLLDALQKLETAPNHPEQCMQIWEDILRHFKIIRTSTADYIAYINSEKTDQRMQTEAFLVYKAQFTNYLRDFIVSLQKTSLQIIELLQKYTKQRMQPFFEQLILKERSIPRLEDVAVTDEQLLAYYEEYFQSIKRWFLEINGQKSELEVLQWQTNEMIRRITRYVQRLGERQHHFKSRRNDYLHLAKWFIQCETLEEAHEVSAIVFGAMQVKHVQLKTYTTDDLHADTWDEKPEQINIKPRTNRYREKTKATSISLQTEQKRAQRELYLKERQQQEQAVQAYFKDGSVQLSQLQVIEPFMRKLLLSWMSKARVNKEGLVLTESGMLLRVKSLEQKIVLQALDGDLHMRDVVFELVKEAKV